MKIKCAHCEKEINRKPSYIKKYQNICCSKECKNKFAVTSITSTCNNCGKEVVRTQSQLKKSKSGNTFCSHSCSASVSNKVRSKYISAYKQLAFDNLDIKCNRCGYDDIEEILQVHHIDRDRENNTLKNLEILCPTCHFAEHFLNKDGNFWNLTTSP